MGVILKTFSLQWQALVLTPLKDMHMPSCLLQLAAANFSLRFIFETATSRIIGARNDKPCGSKQTQIISRAMNYTMNPNDAVFYGIKDKVILNNEEAISHIDQFFLLGYLAHKGIGGEIR